MAVLEQTAVLTDAIRPVPASELEARLEKFRRLMDEMHPGWEMAAVNHKIAMYYFICQRKHHASVAESKQRAAVTRRYFILL